MTARLTGLLLLLLSGCATTTADRLHGNWTVHCVSTRQAPSCRKPEQSLTLRFDKQSGLLTLKRGIRVSEMATFRLDKLRKLFIRRNDAPERQVQYRFGAGRTLNLSFGDQRTLSLRRPK